MTPRCAPRALTVMCAVLALAASSGRLQSPVVTPALQWVRAEGVSPSATALLARLAAAGDDGLRPEEYEGAELQALAARLKSGAHDLSSPEVARFDERLTRNALRFLKHLHLGRVEAREVGFQLDHQGEPHDFAAVLDRIAAGEPVNLVVDQMQPPFAQYRELRRALGEFRGRDALRAQRIELSMERLRWLPDYTGERLIVVNIPRFGVAAFGAERSAGVPDLTMDAIVGRAAGTKTPVFTGVLTAVVFNPEWNVPASIVRNEILPMLRRDPSYLARNHMEIVEAGPIPRVRQTPGPWNALGRVKFVFPNEYDVFMHDTPAPHLFTRPRRDFSHGCIRIAEPLALAEWVLSRTPGWTAGRIEAAVASRSTSTVPLADGPRVVVFYTTVHFDPAAGRLSFDEDIYGHDARLLARLNARRAGDQ